MSHVASAIYANPSLEHAVSFLGCLFPSPRPFTIRLWDGSELPASGRPCFTLRLNHAGAVRRMFTPPLEISLTEAYIYGDFDIEGDIFIAFHEIYTILTHAYSLREIAALARALVALPISKSSPLTGRGPARLHGAIHSRERDRAAIQYHYDVGNDFYALWLDRHMQYSCGYFPTGQEDLDTAQTRKMEHSCRKLRLQPGDRLLDIGCGWGGLAMYAAETYQANVVGVTLSRNQAAYANDRIASAGLNGRVTIELKDYRELNAESFDKIISVGMFEHVGRQHLPEYFARTCRLLKSGGLFLNHGIAYWPGSEYADGVPPGRSVRASGVHRFLERWLIGSGAFSQRYIFPDGELVPVSEVNLIAERTGFEVRDVENLREHYALTLRHWAKRLEEHREQAIRAASEVTYRTWRLFLVASAYAFETGRINVNQTLLSKPADGKCNLPLTRADIHR